MQYTITELGIGPISRTESDYVRYHDLKYRIDIKQFSRISTDWNASNTLRSSVVDVFTSKLGHPDREDSVWWTGHLKSYMISFYARTTEIADIMDELLIERKLTHGGTDE